MQDVVAGQIETTFVNTATSLPQVRAGSIKAFAVTAKNRLAIAPDIPSVDEVGLPGLQQWRGEIPRTMLIARDGATTVIDGVADLKRVRAWLDAQSSGVKLTKS
jgi:hypothetical protein